MIHGMVIEADVVMMRRQRDVFVAQRGIAAAQNRDHVARRERDRRAGEVVTAAHRGAGRGARRDSSGFVAEQARRRSPAEPHQRDRTRIARRIGDWAALANARDLFAAELVEGDDADRAGLAIPANERSDRPAIEPLRDIEYDELSGGPAWRDEMRGVTDRPGIDDRRLLEHARWQGEAGGKEVGPELEGGAAARDESRTRIHLDVPEGHRLEVGAAVARRLEPEAPKLGRHVRGGLEGAQASRFAAHHRIVSDEVEALAQVGGGDLGFGGPDLRIPWKRPRAARRRVSGGLTSVQQNDGDHG